MMFVGSELSEESLFKIHPCIYSSRGEPVKPSLRISLEAGREEAAASEVIVLIEFAQLVKLVEVIFRVAFTVVSV